VRAGVVLGRAVHGGAVGRRPDRVERLASFDGVDPRLGLFGDRPFLVPAWHDPDLSAGVFRIPRVRRGVVALLCLSAGTAGASAAPTGGGTVAFVAAAHPNRLVVVDVDTRRRLGSVPLSGRPIAVATAALGRRVVVTGADGSVTLLDGIARRVIEVLPGFSNPADVGLSQSGHVAFVIEKGRGTLDTIDLDRGRVVQRVRVGARPNRLAVGDSLIWIAHESNQGSLTRVQTGRRQVRTFAAGGPVRELVRQPDSVTLFVTYWHSGDVGAIDGGSERLLFRRRTGTRVGAIAIDDGTPAVWAVDTASGVATVLAEDGRVVRRVRVGSDVRQVVWAVGFLGAVAVVQRERITLYQSDGRRGRSFRIAGGIAAAAFTAVP